MTAGSDAVYMADPPRGEDRFAAGNVAAGMVAAGATTTIIALVTVALRLFTRIHIVKRSLGIDDYLILASMIMSVVFLATAMKTINLGVGYHFWQVKSSDYDPGFLIYGTCTTMIYSLAGVSSKLSLLFLYLRLSPDRSFRIIVLSMIASVTAYSIAYQLLSLFGCQPVWASWDAVALRTAKCVDKDTVYMALSIVNIVMDVFIFVLPLKIVIALQMPRSQKALVALLFATGTFVCASAIKRTIIIFPLLKSQDHSWDVAELFNWSFLEANVGIVCASAPGLKPFFVRYLPSFISSRITDSVDGTGKMSLPYATVIEKNKKRRNMQTEAFELQSNDDLSESGSTKGGSHEDQTKLWSGRAYRRDPMNQRETVIESRTREFARSSEDITDDTELASAGDTCNVLRSGARSQTPSGGRGIKVTQETQISYPP